MKNLILICLLFATITSFSQFTVATADGDPINNNDIFTFNEATYPESNFEWVVTNTAGHDIDVVINVESISNANGSLMELCFGLCYTGINVGNTYPPANSPYHLATGASSEPHGNHFLNTQDGSDIITYLFRFHEVDASGNEIGTPLRVTYRYDAAAVATTDLNQVEFSIFPTVVKNGQVQITAIEDLTLTFTDALGKIVKKENVSSETTFLNVNDLTKQIYFVTAENNKGQRTLKTLVIK